VRAVIPAGSSITTFPALQDVDVATDELRESGFKPLLDKPARGEGHAAVNFTHPRDMAGVQLEFIEVPG
jgi:methylmalonyl-CoA/ethylmalonyl-CoA epimerase